MRFAIGFMGLVLLTGPVYARQSECKRSVEALTFSKWFLRELRGKEELSDQARIIQTRIAEGFKRDLSKGTRIELGKIKFHEEGGFGFVYLKREGPDGEDLSVSITKIVGFGPHDARPVFLGEMGKIQGLESRLNPFLSGIGGAVGDYIEAHSDVRRVVIRAYGVMHVKLLETLREWGFEQSNASQKMRPHRFRPNELKDGIDMELVVPLPRK